MIKGPCAWDWGKMPTSAFNVKFRGTSVIAFQSVVIGTTDPGGCRGAPVGLPAPPRRTPPPLVLTGRPPCSPAPSQRAGHMVTQLSPAQQRVPLLRGTARGPRAVPAARGRCSTPQLVQPPRQPHPWLGGHPVGGPGRGAEGRKRQCGERKHWSLPQKDLSMP